MLEAVLSVVIHNYFMSNTTQFTNFRFIIIHSILVSVCQTSGRVFAKKITLAKGYYRACPILFFLFFTSGLHVPMIAFKARLLGHMAQIVALRYDFFEWRNLFTGENSTGGRWNANPGPCR